MLGNFIRKFAQSYDFFQYVCTIAGFDRTPLQKLHVRIHLSLPSLTQIAARSGSIAGKVFRIRFGAPNIAASQDGVFPGAATDSTAHSMLPDIVPDTSRQQR